MVLPTGALVRDMLQRDGSRSVACADMRRCIADPDRCGGAGDGLVRPHAGWPDREGRDRPAQRARLCRPCVHDQATRAALGDVSDPVGGDAVVEPGVRGAGRVPGRCADPHRHRLRLVHQARLHAVADGDLARGRDRLHVRPRAAERHHRDRVADRSVAAADVGAADADRRPDRGLRRDLSGGRRRFERSRCDLQAGDRQPRRGAPRPRPTADGPPGDRAAADRHLANRRRPARPGRPWTGASDHGAVPPRADRPAGRAIVERATARADRPVARRAIVERATARADRPVAQPPGDRSIPDPHAARHRTGGRGAAQERTAPAGAGAPAQPAAVRRAHRRAHRRWDRCAPRGRAVAPGAVARRRRRGRAPHAAGVRRRGVRRHRLDGRLDPADRAVDAAVRRAARRRRR